MSPLAERMAPVTARLSRLRGAIRTLFALDGLSRLFLAMAAFVVVTFLLDWSLILPAGVRLVHEVRPCRRSCARAAAAT